MTSPEHHLPADVLGRASLRGNEYAWPVSDIPLVIEAARAAQLVSIGGQLQFRLPDGATCEPYWVEVDTFASVSPDLPWSDRVEATAQAALVQFAALASKFDFVDVGRSAFTALQEFEASGGDLTTIMKFVWYVEAEPPLK